MGPSMRGIKPATRTEPMITVDCPICDQPVELDLALSAELACDGCQVRVEIAADPLAMVVPAAA